MRPSLFLDASGWVAALVQGQTGHAHARSAYHEAATAGTRLVTTGLVLAETHALVLRYRGRAYALAFYDETLADPMHEIVRVDAELERAAVDAWLRPRREIALSLCDAVSFEVMRRERIRRALAFDRHFAAAGFEILS